MQWTHRTLCLLCGCAILTIAGCHYPYRYNPYGYGHGTPSYGAPGYPGVPPGGSIQGPGFPGGTVLPDSDGSVYDPGGGGSGTDSNWKRPGDDTSDPDYFEDDGGFRNDGGGLPPQPRDGEEQPMFDETSRGRDGFGQSFKPPTVSVEQATSAQVIGTDGQLRPAFDFDRQNYEWLQGLVDYDSREKAWHIIYDMTPRRSDEFGGDLTLLDHPQLRTLRAGDYVGVTGRVDPDNPDSFGKPRYRINRLERLQHHE